MHIQQKNLYLLTFILSSLSGCSFFEATVQTCEEPQEYLNSYSIPDLVIPDALRELQKQSSFYIPEGIDYNEVSQEEMLPVMREEIKKQVKETDNISGDDLSELLDLIDQTIDGRTNAFDQASYDVTSTVKRTGNMPDRCLDEAPSYFAKGVLGDNGSNQLSERSQAEADEKGWFQRMRDRRQNKKEESGS